MKKSLVITLALVFVLGIAGTAFAANPFTDVPANHWAYAAVSKLAQEGVIEGYGDGRYFGNRTITRYEMAQIVAKAMANMDKAGSASRAQIEKLAAEYADELDSLGVRVAKLEKNADNVKIIGEARFSHYAFDKQGSGDTTPLRSRIWLTGQVNDKWSYQAMLQHDGNDLHNNGNNGTFTFKRAAVFGKIGAVDVTAGRFYHKIYQGILMDASDADGLMLGYKAGDFKITAFATRVDFENKWLRGRTARTDDDGKLIGSNNQIYGATVDYAKDRFHFMAAYYHTDASENSAASKAAGYIDDSSIFELAVDYKFTKELMAWAEYVRGSEEINKGGKDGWIAGLQWSNLNKNKPGTFAVRANYFDVPAAAVINTNVELEFSKDKHRSKGNFDGFKGYQIGATFMAAKNIDINVDYYDLEGQSKRNGDNSLLWSYVRFYF